MFGKIQKFISEAVGELKKVAWTTRQELIDATLIVVVSSVVLGVFIWLNDTVLAYLLRLLIR